MSCVAQHHRDAVIKETTMSVKKIFGFLAVAGLLFVAAPAERAQAASLNGPGIAAAVQTGSAENLTTEVQYRRYHRGYHPHRGYRVYRGYGRPHYGWRRPHFAPRPHFYGRRHHYRY
jgi:hypothetical protein